MLDFSDFFESLLPEPVAIDIPAWMMFAAFVATLCLALKMWKGRYIARFPLFFLTLLSLGLPGIWRLFVNNGLDANPSRVLWIVQMFPDLITNSLIICASGELLINATNQPRRIGIAFNIGAVSLISVECWILGHLDWNHLSVLVEVAFGAALSLAALCPFLIFFKSRKARSMDSTNWLLTGAIAGSFLSANLMRFVPSASFTVSQIEGTTAIASTVSLLVIAGFWFFLESGDSLSNFQLNTRNSYGRTAIRE
jgi:hypothetical protein